VVNSITFELPNNETMQTIIFKSENKAKIYELRAAKTEGVYKQGELIYKVKTDDVSKLIYSGGYERTAHEVKE